MPEFDKRGIRAYLTAPPLADTVTRDPQRKKHEATVRSEAAEKALRKEKQPLSEKNLQPGPYQQWESRLEGVPFFQVQAGADLFDSSQTLPRALVLNVVLSKQTFLPTADHKKPENLRIDVFFNGILSSSVLMLLRDIKSEAKSMHQIFAGSRNDILTERPWSILPPGLNSDGTPRLNKASTGAEDRWEQIGKALHAEADDRGFRYSDDRPPSAKYLENLANMKMPEFIRALQIPGGRKFGVVDVVVTLGNGRKTTNYIQGPTWMADPRFQSKADGRLDYTRLQPKTHARGIPSSRDAEGDTDDSDYELCHNGTFRKRIPQQEITTSPENEASKDIDLSIPGHLDPYDQSQLSNLAVSSPTLATLQDAAPHVRNDMEALHNSARTPPFAETPAETHFSEGLKEHVTPAELELHPSNIDPSSHAPRRLIRGESSFFHNPLAFGGPVGSPTASPFLAQLGFSPPPVPVLNFPYIGPVQHAGPLPPLGLFNISDRPRSQKDHGFINPDIPHPSILISRVVIKLKRKTIIDHRWAVPQRFAVKPVIKGAPQTKREPKLVRENIKPKLKRQTRPDESPGSAEYADLEGSQRKSRKLAPQLKTPPATSPDSMDLERKAMISAVNKESINQSFAFGKATLVPVSKQAPMIGGPNRNIVRDGHFSLNTPQASPIYGLGLGLNGISGNINTLSFSDTLLPDHANEGSELFNAHSGFENMDRLPKFNRSASNPVAKDEKLNDHSGLDHMDGLTKFNHHQTLMPSSEFAMSNNHMPMSNTGMSNTGMSNTGMYNSGMYNSGMFNYGMFNPGIANPGIANPGFSNIGMCNTEGSLINPLCYTGQNGLVIHAPLCPEGKGFPSYQELQMQRLTMSQAAVAASSYGLPNPYPATMQPIFPAEIMPSEVQRKAIPWLLPQDIANEINEPFGGGAPYKIGNTEFQVNDHSNEPDTQQAAYEVNDTKTGNFIHRGLQSNGNPVPAEDNMGNGSGVIDTVNDTVTTTTNPGLCQDCSICFAEVDHEEEIVVRQVKGEKAGSFTEDTVLVGFRFFVAG